MKVKKLKLGKICLLFFVCIVFANAKIGNLNPFLFAFFFACLYVGLNEKLLAAFVFAGSMIVNSTLQNLFVTITVIAVGLIVFYIHKIFKRKYFLITNLICYCISLVTFIYYNFSNAKLILMYLILGVIFLFVCVVVMQIVLIRNNCLKLTLDESVCFMFFLIAIGLGLFNLTIFQFSIYRFIVMLFILLGVSVGYPSLTYCLTLSFSFGLALSNFSLLPVAEFMILAMLANVFSMPHRFKMVILTVIGDFAVQYLFITKGFEVFFSVLPIIVAGIIFICIPKSCLQNLSNMVYVKKSEIGSRNIINTTRKNLRKRMSELSNVFLDMKQIHLNMVKKNLTKEEIISMLSREVMNSCCKDCLDKNRCTRSLGLDNKSNLEELLEIAVTKGKITLLDIPSAMGNRCAKINNLIGLINRLSEEYRQYKNVISDINNVKILLADQMGAVSSLLLDIGNEIDTNVKFDIANENKIISKLLSNNIQCKEVLLYAEKNSNLSAEIIVGSKNFNNVIVEKIVSQYLKTNMEITKITPLEEAGFNSVTLIKKSKYDCAFGLSSCNKAGEIECGDCHSIIRLNKNKFLLALCDGMGSGKNAHIMSAITLGLIENFYKVGFDNEIIIESVNKLLAVNNQENYSTLDICVIDLDKCIADFIKVGAPFGLIKREGSIEKVEGGTLPIGALETINPVVSKVIISIKDIIILATDGITDAFKTEENLIDYVSKLATNNPQTIADSILNEAILLNSMSAKDDMTVLVARTYLKN